MQTLHETELTYTQDHKLDLNGIARTLLEDLVNTVMVEQVEELGCVRNGYRERKLVTSVGTLTLKIPKLREGTYFPDDIVSKWSRCDTALASCICDMWTLGISSRKVEKALSELGVEKISRNRVSRLVKSLDEEVDDLRHGSLSFDRWPYLWLDATYIPIREAGHTTKRAVVIAIAVNTEAKRQIIGLECIDTESYLSWKDFLISLRERGLSGVKLVISDAHAGLVRAIGEVLTGAAWQNCLCHLERNVFDRCRTKAQGKAVIAAMKHTFEATDTDLVRTGFEHLYEVYEKIDPKGAHLLEESEPYVLTYLDFPKEHAHWIRTNNLCERLNKEIKKRTRVVGVFPLKQAMLRLVGAVCINQNEEWFVATHFMDKHSLLFEERPKRESCTQETIDHLLQVIDSDFNACKEVA